MVGTMFVEDRDKARAVGFIAHTVNGWVFAAIYIAGFHALGIATWWLGALAGLLHALVVLSVGMEIMPGLHPRMATELQGPTVVKQLEPPGFFALHYGAGTPWVSVLAHMVYGAMLGGLYTLPS